MTHTQTAPTGRRRITPAMLSARAARRPHYDPTTPGKTLSAFKRASTALGIPRRVVELVDYLVGRTFPSDWQGGPIIAWPSNATLSDALDLGRSQIKTLIRVGQELGLFEMRDAPDGKRFGTRDNGGRITLAYGFDLTPLAARRDEFEQVARAHAEARAEGRRLRGQITAERNAVLSLCDMARETEAAGDWARVDAEARRIAALRGSSYEPRQLAPILAQLAMLRTAAIEALMPVEVVDNSTPAASENVAEGVDINPMGPKNWPLLTSTNTPSISKVNTNQKMDGPNRPGVITKGADHRSLDDLIKASARAAPVRSGKKERRRESALRGFIVTPDFVMQIAPAFRPWIKSANPTWKELLEASFYVRAELGISQHAWGQACVILGQTEAVATITAIAARYAAGEVKSPGGLLRRMVELHETGELRLDRTLFGLADGLKGTAH
ncbi:Plasmid replication protein RepC [Candidatus Burkholderia verschuerenii]|uniref:Plasmid replication protein RepC n=1 Tax=Candidatus Burkholderia verschuerenii TaxID=242163 RepID=A0A0L0MGR6_9BURK|nr:plasmid replication protein RepC [Candidatus Burkholderia verschuerenii]KND61513.1 Plasmid replication protein RepC [Candidatus Burkholderia verschuerenii]